MTFHLKYILRSPANGRIRPEFFILLFIPFFGSCSWQEYFTIVNDTNFPANINYTLNDSGKGFGIFDNNPAIYPHNPTGDPDWSRKLSIRDTDTSQYGIQVILPPKSTIVLGSLANDHYENHNQKEINDRVNVKSISIDHPERVIDITQENFGSFFKKRNGNIEFRINSLTLNK